MKEIKLSIQFSSILYFLIQLTITQTPKITFTLFAIFLLTKDSWLFLPVYFLLFPSFKNPHKHNILCATELVVCSTVEQSLEEPS